MSSNDDAIQRRRQLMSHAIEKLNENKANVNVNVIKSKKRLCPDEDNDEPVNKKKETSKNTTGPKIQLEQTAKTGSFGIQTRIMRYMKDRHLKGDWHPISIDEIMNEMNEKYHSDIIKHLETEFFANNTKIEMENGKYKFKPRYNIKSRSELLELLKKHFEEGLENILLSDVLESYRKGEISVRRLEQQNKLIRIVRKRDQNTILLYKKSDDIFDNLGDCTSFINVFHSINIDTVSLSTIEDKLQMDSMKSCEPEIVKSLKKPVRSRPKKCTIRTNALLADKLTL